MGERIRREDFRIWKESVKALTMQRLHTYNVFVILCAFIGMA